MQCLGHVRAGGDAVDGDAVERDSACERLCKGLLRALGGGVMHLPEQRTLLGGDGGGHDYAPVVVALHNGDGVLAA